MTARRESKLTGKKSRVPIEVLFVAGFGPISRDSEGSRKLYLNTLRLPFEELPGGYLSTEKLPGSRHFALWPLNQVAESCFGSSEWPAGLGIPQAWVEFDVEDIRQATDELSRQGYRLLVESRKEPWGQTVTRLLSPEGLLVGLTHTPWMRDSSE